MSAIFEHFQNGQKIYGTFLHAAYHISLRALLSSSLHALQAYDEGA